MVDVLYTIGYEGRTQRELIERLQAAGIRCLIDVRRNAISRKRGFSKGALKEWCGQHALRYVHIPQLGIPSALRKHYLADGRYDELLAVYAGQILPKARGEVDRVIKMASKAPCVLMCFESDPRHCHRSGLARWIGERTRMTIQHLE